MRASRSNALQTEMESWVALMAMQKTATMVQFCPETEDGPDREQDDAAGERQVP